MKTKQGQTARTPKTKAEWEKLAEEAYESGRKASRKHWVDIMGQHAGGFLEKWSDKLPSSKLGMIAIVKFIARKLK